MKAKPLLKNINITYLLVIAVLLVSGAYVAANFSLRQSQNNSGSKFALPRSREVYQIVQAAEKRPRIIEAVINPPDVHVGDKQTLSIVVSDPDGIASVEAQIQTDHSTTTLPLKYIRAVSDSEIGNSAYSVDSNNRLVLNKPGSSDIALGTKVAKANEGEKLLYEASWIVKDTHDTTYHTTFMAKNVKGDTNSITLAWSDACGIPNGGSWNINTFGNCTISSPDGVDNGTTTIATYTLTLNSSFAFNPGFGITISSGAIAVGAGGQLTQTYIWGQDSDGDTYPKSTYTLQNTTPGVTWARRYTFSNGTDCYDSNGDAHPNQTLYFGSQRGDGSFDYNCDGQEEGDRTGLYTLLCSSVPTCATIEVAGWDTIEPGCGGTGNWDPGGGSCSYWAPTNSCVKSNPETLQNGPKNCR